MLDLIKKVFGLGPTVNFAALIAEGAQIVDVRSKNEFQGGHIKGSVNIPLQTLSTNLTRISKDKTVIVCCASGIRSSTAKQLLKSHGYTQVHNGGGWRRLQNQIEQKFLSQ